MADDSIASMAAALARKKAAKRNQKSAVVTAAADESSSSSSVEHSSLPQSVPPPPAASSPTINHQGGGMMDIASLATATAARQKREAPKDTLHAAAAAAAKDINIIGEPPPPSSIVPRIAVQQLLRRRELLVDEDENDNDQMMMNKAGGEDNDDERGALLAAIISNRRTKIRHDGRNDDEVRIPPQQIEEAPTIQNGSPREALLSAIIQRRQSSDAASSYAAAANNNNFNDGGENDVGEKEESFRITTAQSSSIATTPQEERGGGEIPPMSIAAMAAEAAKRKALSRSKEGTNGEDSLGDSAPPISIADMAAAAAKKKALSSLKVTVESDSSGSPMSIAAMAAAAAQKRALSPPKSSESSDSSNGGPPMSIAAMAAVAAQKKNAVTPKASSDEDNSGRPPNIAALAAAAALQKASSSTPKAVVVEGSDNDNSVAPPINIAAMAAAAAAQKKNTLRTPPQKAIIEIESDYDRGPPSSPPIMSIAAMAAAAARKKVSSPEVAESSDSSDGGSPTNIAAHWEEMSLSSPRPSEKTLESESDESETAAAGTPSPPMSIAAMAAAAARKKTLSPPILESDKEDAAPLSIAAMAAAAARKKMTSSPKAAESDGVAPMSIAAMAAAAAAQKKTLSPPTLESGKEDAAPLSIAAMAAAAAQKKTLSSPKVAESDGVAPMSIAAMAAAAAQKKSLASPKAVESDGVAPMSIAAMAAAAAQKKTLSSPKAVESDGVAPMSIAAMAAAAAQKKASLSAIDSDVGGGPPNIAALAAAAARKKATTPQASDDSGGRPNIAALAAAAALKKAASPKSVDTASGESAPPINIAAMAAAAAQKKAASPKSADTGGGESTPPINIAAMAAAAAQKKALTPPKASESESNCAPSMSIAALAAAAAQKKASTPKVSDNSRGPSLSISAMAAEAAKKKTLTPKAAFSPPDISGMAASAARNRQQQQQHHQIVRPQMSSLPQRTQQQRKPQNIIIQQHHRRRDGQSLPRAYNSPTDIRAMELHKKQSEKAKLEAQRNNLQLLERRGQMRQMHSSLGGNGSVVDPLERLVLRQNTSTSASSHSYELKSGDSSSSTKSDSFDLTHGIANLPKNTIFTQLKDDSIIDFSSDENVAGDGVEGSSSGSRKRSYYHSTHEQEQRHPQSDSTELKLSSLRSSAIPSRSLDKVRERRKRQIYDDDVDDSFNFAEESPSEDVHDKAAQALLRVIRMKNLDFDNVLEKLEDLGRRQKGRGSSSHGRRDKENRRQKRRVSNAHPLSTPENDNIHDDDSSIGDLSTESADHRRLAKNAHKLANHIMQTPQQEFAAKKVPLKEDPEYNLYFRMLRYGFTMGAVRAALSRDGKPDITRLDPDRPLCVQKVPRALDRFSRQDSVEVSGLEIGHDGVTDEGWEHALNSAREASDLSFISSPGVLVNERTPRKNSFSGRISPGTPASPPPWLHQNQADRGIVQGWLRKKTRRGRWVRRWYYLDATGMYYSHAPPTSRSTSSKLGKYTKLADTRALKATKSATNPLEFELWHQSNSNALVTLRAHSLIELNEWVDAVSNAIERQRLVDEVVVGHVVPVGELRNKVGVLGGGLFGDGSGDSIGVGGSPDRVDGTGRSGDDLGTGGGGYGDGFGSESGGFGDGSGNGYGDDNGGGQGTGVKAAMSSRNLRSVMDGESLNVGEDGSALISSAALDEVKRLFTVGSGPLIPQISTPQPKRPKLKRQNSWPPISLMSNGDFVLGDGLSDKKIDDDLKKKSAGGDKKLEEDKDLQLDSDGEPKLKSDPKYAEYFTMLKNGTSKESVQETMKSKGLDPSILDLDPEKSLKSQQAPKKEDGDGEPPLKDDPKYFKYFKMLKMGLPKEAVKHAMKRDAVEDDSILDLDPEKSLKSQRAPQKEEGDGEPPLKDDPKYSKYFKMIKMGLPKEAAKHAMKRDGIEDDSILDLDPEKSLKSQRAPQKEEEDTGPPLKDDPKYSKYFKMLKMGLPKEAAKHAMKRDGIEDDSILDLDPEKSLKSQQARKEEDTGPPLKDDPKYTKYFKMMKMGLPKEAAKHAMVRDQLDPSILDLDPEKSLKSQMGGGEEDTGPPLKDDPKFAKYFKMLKMGLPMGAVKNALTRDGLDPGIMDLDHDKSVNSQLDAKKKSVLKGFKINKKPKIRRKKVYWTQVDATEGTVWQAVKSSKIVLDIDIDEFEKLFTQAIDADKEREKKEKESTKSSKKSGTVKVIDSKRGMNGDIILRKVKLSPTEVATLIENMDTGTLDAVELKSLYEFMPTDEEIKALTAYLESSKDKTEEIRYMTPCEQYMVAMKDLKDSDKKFQCIIFLSEFGNKMKELKWDVDHLSAACKQLRSSKRFRTLLKMILILVNKINTGEDGGAIADGFTLDTLAKLNETKAFDNKTTVLYYLVKLIRKTNIDVLKFTEDIKDVVLAKGVVMERLLSSAKQLCEDARVAEETAAKDGDLYRQSLKDPSQQWKFTNKFTNVKAQRGSVKEIRQMVNFLTEKDVPVCKVDSTHFERFAAFAKLELQQALGVIKEANQQFIEILEFFGEDTNTQVGDFFGLIDQFMVAFDQTQDQVEKEEEEKLKEARRALAKEAKLKVKSAFKNAADATKMADEKSSKKGLFPTMESSRKVLRKGPKETSDKLDSGTAIPDPDAKESINDDSRHALFAALKSRRVEHDRQDEEVTFSEALQQEQEEEAMEEARKKEAEKQVQLEVEQQQSLKERAKLAEIQRKENIKKLEEEADRERLQAEAEFEKQRRVEREREEREFQMREARIAHGQMERVAKKTEQEAALRAKIEAEEERKRKEAELRARIEAIERARKEEEERNERARKAEEERKREKLEMRKREQDELRARIEAEAMARKELEDRRQSIEQRHKAKEEEKALREREAREQKKKELRAKIMAEEKAQRDIKERKRREMELRARIMEESRKLQEDNIEDDLRAWLSKKEKMKSSVNIASSSKPLRAKPASSNDVDEKDLQSWISKNSQKRLSQSATTQPHAAPDGSTSRPKPSRQPSRLSMAVAQAAAAKQRRESSVVMSTMSSAAPSPAEAPQKAISTSALKTTVEAVKSDEEVKEDEDLMAWLKKRKKKTAKN